MSERQQWVRDNMPVIAAIANEFKAEFGDVRLVFASENGHVIGKPSWRDDEKPPEKPAARR